MTVENDSRTMKWICCQLGAREHYAIPRALFRLGRSMPGNGCVGPGLRRFFESLENGDQRSEIGGTMN